MYELGVAHALNKRVVMITQDREELPFDLSGYQVHEYSTDFRGVTPFRDYISNVAAKSLSDTVTFGNPVGDALRELELASSHPTGSCREEVEAPVAGTDDAQTMGFLEHATDYEETMASIARMYESLCTTTHDYGSKIDSHTVRWQEWQRDGKPGGFGRAKDMAAAFADDMFAYAKSIERETEGIDEKAALLERCIPVLIADTAIAEDTRHQACEAMRSFHSALVQSVGVTSDTAKAMRQFQQSTEAAKGIHSRLDAAIGTVNRRIGNVLSFIDRFRSIGEAAIAQLEARIEAECPSPS